MEPPNRGRRLIALCTAYAVAMQALLSALVPVAPAALSDSLAILCSHDGGSNSPAEQKQPCSAMCAALGHGLAGPMPPEFLISVSRPQTMIALAPPSDWAPPFRSLRGSQAPRGPPLA